MQPRTEKQNRLIVKWTTIDDPGEGRGNRKKKKNGKNKKKLRGTVHSICKGFLGKKSFQKFPPPPDHSWPSPKVIHMCIWNYLNLIPLLEEYQKMLIGMQA